MKHSIISALLSVCIVFNGLAGGHVNLMVSNSGSGRSVIMRNWYDNSRPVQEKIVIMVAEAPVNKRKNPFMEKLIGAAELAGAAGSLTVAYRLSGAALRELQDIGGYLQGTTVLWSDVQKRFLPMLGCVSATFIGFLLGCDAKNRFKS